MNKILNKIKEITKFPFQVFFDPYSAKSFFDRCVCKYDSTPFKKLNYLYSWKIRRKFNDQKNLRINIGCGQWRCDGWIGVDSSNAYPYKNKKELGFDVDWNVLGGLPFNDVSVKYVFVSHFLEHLTYNESIKLLNECYRVMEKGGVIRLIVPDLDLFIKKFIEKDVEFFKQGEIAGGGWLNNLTDTFLMNFYSGPDWNNSCHKYAYNFENISNRLLQCGFRKIIRSDYMKSAYSEFNKKSFDSFNSKVPLFSLYVEAVK